MTKVPAKLRQQARANAIAQILVAMDASPGRLDALARHELGEILGKLRAERARLLGEPVAEGSTGAPPVVAGASPDSPTPRALSFADWFRESLPPTVRPLDREWPARRKAWAQCYDTLLERDGRTVEQIVQVCKWARRDNFWSKNFLSPLKLRGRNQDGVLYFDVLLAKAAPTRPTGAASGQYEQTIKVPRA